MKTDKSSGTLIVFDGMDGTGKSTQVELLVKALQNAGREVITSREPTDGKYGAKVRASSFTGRYSFDEELELFIMDREEHIVDKIVPALMDGKVVILDRYYYSTIAYQGILCDDVAALTSKVKKGVLEPDITFIFDIDPLEASGRMKARDGSWNAFEELTDQIKIRDIYSGLCLTEPNVVKIDADCTIEELHATIIEKLRDNILTF